MHPALRVAGLLLALLAATAARAAVGVLEVPAQGERGPLVLFYPTAQAEASVDRGPFRLRFAPGATPERGNGRLVVISHGSGGSPWPQGDLAKQLAQAGFVVALPLHAGDNWRDASDAGPISWKRRPAEISRTIDAVAGDVRFAPLLSLDRVGVFGMSAGGHAALTLAGGQWSPSLLRKHCEVHLDDDFPTCVGLALQLRGNAFDGAKKAVARLVLGRYLDDATWYSHEDRRVAAVVAEVPFAVDFQPQSLARPRVPLGLVRAGRDAWLAPAHHVDAVLRACTTCTLVADLPTAGHGSLLSPQVPMEDLPAAAQPLLRDPPGFDRALVPQAHARIAAFFRQHLLP